MQKEKLYDSHGNPLRLHQFYLVLSEDNEKNYLEKICRCTLILSETEHEYLKVKYLSGDSQHFKRESARDFSSKLEAIDDEKVRAILLEEKAKLETAWEEFANAILERKII